MLLLFLLAGRFLDQRMRRRTRDVATNLAAIKAEKAIKLIDGGEAVETPIEAVAPGDLVLVRAGERVAVDGIVEDGRSEVDQSLVTGETAPVAVAPGALVYAGALNMSGALRVRVTNAATGTLLDEVNALLGQGDRAALVLCPARRSRRAPLCAGRASDRAGDVPRLARGGPLLAAGAGDRDHRADHHLPLRARPGGAGGAGGRRQRDVPPRPDAQFRRRVGALRRRRYDRLRQDGNADPAAAEPRQRGRHRPRRSGARGIAGAGEQASARQGGGRGGGGQEPARRARIPRPGRHRLPRRQAPQARLARLLQGRGRGGERSRRNGRTPR